MGFFSKKSEQPAAATSHEPASTAPGGALVTNTLVQDALRRWGETKSAQTMNDVLRQCATGELLIDISGSQFADISRGLQPGDTLGVGQVVDNAGKRLLLAFTSNEQLQAYRPGSAPMSLAQPASGVMRQALSDYEGVVIDPSSPDSCIVYSTEIQLGLSQEPGINEALKTAMVDNRPADELRRLAASAPLLFLGVAETRDEAGQVIDVKLPGVQASTGELCSLVFTSPAEVWAFDASLTARPVGLDEVISGARSMERDAIMLDPMGPWAILRVSDLDAA